MRGVITRFLNLDVMNYHPAVPWGILIVWVILLVAALLSLRQTDLSLGARFAWYALIFLVPIAGLAFYTLWSLFHADWTFLKPLFQSRTAAIRAVVDPGKGKRI